MNKSDKIYLEKSLVFWEHLTSKEQTSILSHASLIKYEKGRNLYSAENECMGMLLIKSGELRASLLSDNGREITLYRLGSDDTCILSASCLLANITFDVSIDAEQDTELYLIELPIISELLETNIYVENFALRIAADRFSDVMWAMEQMLFMSIDRRLAIFLLDEVNKSGNETIDLTHEQIAKYMGSAREVVSRTLKHFEHQNIVSLTRSKVTILDKKRLREIAI